MLQVSIALDDAPEPPPQPPRRERTIRDTGERHRGRELRGRPGWAWLPGRRLDEYERALAELDWLERRRRERELDPVEARAASSAEPSSLRLVARPDELELGDHGAGDVRSR